MKNKSKNKTKRYTSKNKEALRILLRMKYKDKWTEIENHMKESNLCYNDRACEEPRYSCWLTDACFVDKKDVSNIRHIFDVNVQQLTRLPEIWENDDD